MTVVDCPRCGGTHFGSHECPFDDDVLERMKKPPEEATVDPMFERKVLPDEAYEALGVDVKPDKVRSLELIKSLFSDAQLERAGELKPHTGNCPE